MPKYIDVGAINWYDDLFMKGINNSGVWVRYKDVESLIRNAPAADVEPVVRCENCQFFENVGYWPDGTKKVCQLLKRQVQDNSFCCWGMKKEADDV